MNAGYEDVGIVFIGPIIGLPPSILAAFDDLRKEGVDIEGVDIFEGQKIKKNLLTVLGLTIFPGSHKRRVAFANSFDEKRLFKIILEKVNTLKKAGKKKIILGGMSGGFIFAARMAHQPPDQEIEPFAKQVQKDIKALFGISPLIFYPSAVKQKGADLDLLPAHIPTLMIWGDADQIIPEGTIEHAQNYSQKSSHIKSYVIRGSDINKKDQTIKHQFFGGKDFIKPLKNIYWDALAEKIALEKINDLIKMI